MKLWQDNRGTTLIEVIAAVTLLTVTLIPLMGGITDTNNAMINAGSKTQAIYLAQEKMEQIKTDYSTTGAINPEGYTPLESPYQKYSRQVVVTEVYKRAGESLIQVEVGVKWGPLLTQQVSLTTQLTGGQDE